MTTRKCNKCGRDKPIEDFGIDRSYANGKILRKNTCKKCKRIQHKASNELKKQHPKPDSIICPICLRYTENHVLDHDHKTHEFRGWLCNDCNSALGKFGDCPEFLERARQYLIGRKRGR
jgi:hypothetical protein